MAGYLIIEIPGLTVPGVPFTAAHRGTTLDLAVTPARDPAHGLDILLLARQVPHGRVPELMRTLEEAFPPVRTLERNDAEGLWLAALSVPLAAFQDPRAARIADFLLTVGLTLYWTRVEDGQCFVRAEIPVGASPDDLATAARAFLARSGIEADVDLEPASVDPGPWRELILRTLGQRGQGGRP